jgi:predicted nucleic acid-binding Zn ribbon protein
VYRFLDTGETIEVQQSFNDPTLTETVHPVTGAKMPVKKVFQPVGVTFRGTGFYKTDSRSSSGGSSKKASSPNGESSSSPPSDTAKSSSETKSSSESTSPAPSSSSSTTSSSSSD